MYDNDTLIKDLAPFVSKVSLETLIRERDRYKVGSLKWNVFNMVKAVKQQTTKPAYSERIMVIEDEKLDGKLSEFTPFDKRLLNFLEKESRPMIRSLAEYFPGYRQIVTNAIVSSNGRYLVLRRTDKFNDGRLHGYVGLPGGHMNANDGTVYMGLLREIQEELKGVDMLDMQVVPVGFIRSMNDNMVISKEHLCCLFLIKVNNYQITSRTNGELSHWYTKEAIQNVLQGDAQQLDNWAKIAFENVFRMGL